MAHWRRIPIQTVYGDPSVLPKTIFVMVEHLQNFHDHLLPCFDEKDRFVLIIGDGDLTTPRQMDRRYSFKPPAGVFYPTGPTKHSFKYSTWLSWLDDSRVVHLFVEHLDEKNHSKVSPIPTGLNPQEFPRNIMHLTVDEMLEKFPSSPPRTRSLKIRFINRVRSGHSQWELRRLTKKACDTVWKHLCVSSNVPGGAFFTEIAKYSFVICAHGGGLDPNPMAWSALMVGSIPIIQPLREKKSTTGFP